METGNVTSPERKAMSLITKALLLTTAVSIALLAGVVAALLDKADGATVWAAIRAGGIGFGATLTLLMLTITTYAVL
ncbi:hypothetical protein [Nocardia sp. NPDC050793]|uniref:hypothetical protein n=1 Tax=Nocardia sp. NPDC050793 TaxID=3155159 RepID=UPI0033EA7DC3